MAKGGGSLKTNKHVTKILEEEIIFQISYVILIRIQLKIVMYTSVKYFNLFKGSL